MNILKKILLILIFVTSFSYTFATRGACSYHNGVNCGAGASYYGKVQCNDGWVNSSVSYSDAEECKQGLSDLCPVPKLFGAVKSESCDGFQRICDNSNNSRLVTCSSLGIPKESDNCKPQDCPLAESCKKEVEINKRLLELHEQCVKNQFDILNFKMIQSAKESAKMDYDLKTSMGIKVARPDLDEKCQQKFGQSHFDNLKNSCVCNEGTDFYDDQNGITQCRTKEQACKVQFGIFSYLKGENCLCYDGYSFSYLNGKKWCAVASNIQNSFLQQVSQSTTSMNQIGTSAIKYVFKKNLQLGSRGTEVIELQKVLRQLGLLNSVPSGYFGSQTKIALQNYQSNNGITSTGTLGPTTRAKLNQ